MDGISRSHTRWNAIAQQALVAQLDRTRDPDIEEYSMDKWDGYRVPRQRLLRFMGRHGQRNPVVLTGDIHRHVASDLRIDFARPDTPAVAAEFVTSSISSRGDRRAMTRRYAAWLDQNPHLRFISDLRGYNRFTVTRDTWHTDFRVVDHVSAPGASIRTQASAVVEAGRPGITLS